MFYPTGWKTALAETLRDLGDLTGARALQEREIEVRRDVRGGEDAETLEAMSQLAVTLQVQGDLAGAGTSTRP